ncbi:MAG TPA: hypothetical protein VFU46_03735 [Gemmatimonadales bacterium]|nr:hypothetical protein [Gemmatimonadales bacterium]
MTRDVTARVAALVALAALAAPALGAQQRADGIRRAFELERRGSYAEAAEGYRAALAERPAEPAALFGLERSLVAMNRVADILPQARAAVDANPKAGAFHGVLLRAWAAAGQPDSVRAVAERWASVEPHDDTPFREWGLAALVRRDRVEARRAFVTGRERLGRADALAAELAQVAVQQQDWPQALREWLLALARVPGYRASAVATLGPAPASARAELLRHLAADRSPPARRLEAELRARWGDPTGGFEALAAALPKDRAAAVEALVGFLDQIRTQGGPAARRAQAMTLAAIAERTPGPQGTRFRLDAAQAFADAGDQAAARRLLDGVAADSVLGVGAPPDAGSTIIGVLLAENKVEEAERRLASLAGSMSAEQHARLRRQLAWGWVRAGRLGRADSLLVADSTVDGLAVRGRIALLRGDLGTAVDRLTGAGPFAGSREEATARTMLLALLQAIDADSLPALGAAMLALEQGDTTEGIAGLERTAGQLSAERGGAELLLYAGAAARTAGRAADAERLFRAAIVPEARATAPAAELALGRLLLETERASEAIKVLEHLILTYPESALVPQARRTLDQARGAVPPT